MFSLAGGVFSAAIDDSAEPYKLIQRCLKCENGTVTMTTSRRYEHDEKFPCKNRKNGYDLFAVYEEVRGSVSATPVRIEIPIMSMCLKHVKDVKQV